MWVDVDSPNLFWQIFRPGKIRVKVTQNPAAPTASIADFKFSVNVHPGSTGLFVVENNNLHCDPTDLGGAETDWKLGQTTHFDLKRCGLGTRNNQGFTVKALHVPSNQIVELGRTGSVLQAPHREFGKVTYSMNLDAAEGVRLPYIPADNFDAATAKTAVRIAAETMNMELRKPQAVTPQSSDADVEVKAYYWVGNAPKCIGIACIKTDDSSRPHRGDADLWIKYPPSGRFMGDFPEWTDDVHVMRTGPIGLVYYLPAVVMHEFGHALGVSHLPDLSGHLMGPKYYPPSTDTSLSSNDRYGILQAMSSHQHD